MATQVIYSGDGVTTQFDVTFSFPSNDTIHVYVDGVEQTFSWVNSTRIELTTAPASGAEVLIRRETDIGTAVVTFSDEAVLTEGDLNGAVRQLISSSQEAADAVDDLEDRAVKVPAGEKARALPEAADRAGKLAAYSDLDSGAGLVAVSVDQSAFDTVVGLGDDIQTVSSHAADITTLAGNLNGSNTVGTVADSIDVVQTVGVHMSDVSSAASNMSAITAAPGYASAAEASAAAAALSAARLDAGVISAPTSLTTARALTAIDAQNTVLANIPGPGADTIATIIVPSNSNNELPIGTRYEIVRTAGSVLRFASDSTGAAVIVGPAAGKTVVGDNAWARLIKEGTDQWRLYGVLGNPPATAIAPKVWFDASDLSTMKQERTGASATTAAAVGQPVGSWRNKGSLGGWAVIDSDAKRPILRQTNGFYEVVFDGVDDVLRLPTPGLNLASIEIYIGYRYSGTGGVAAFSIDGLLTLAPATASDYNQNTGMAFYLSSTGTQLNWVGGGNGSGGSTMIVSASGVMTNNAHTVELRKTAANSATMTLDANPGNGQISQSTATTSFGTQGGDLIMGARQGNGVANWGKVAIRSVVITNEPVGDPSSIRAHEESKTYGTVPIYPSISDTTQLSAARATLVSELFGGGSLPTALATMAIETPNPGGLTFTNLAQVEKLTIPGYAARPRLWTPNSPRNDVIFLVVAGHSAGWGGNGISTFVMQPLLSANVRVCTFVLPGGPNDYTSGGPTDHESGTLTLADWIGPVSIAINTLRNLFPSAAIHMTGISGGGWMTTVAAAADDRIAKSYQFVGSLPDMIYVNRDFEQRLDGVTADYLTLYMLAASPGRRHMQVLYENDPVAFSRANFSTRPDYSSQMALRAAAVGGGDYDLNWVNFNQHAYTSAFSTLVMSELP